jgi:hypothetical protein
MWRRTKESKVYGPYENVDDMFKDMDFRWNNRTIMEKIYDWFYFRRSNFRDIKYWFLYRFHPKYKYHVLHTGFPPGWRDRDLVLAAIIRKIIIDFVEREKPYEHFDTEDSRHAQEWIQLKELYNWFKSTDLWFDDVEYDDLTDKLVEAVRLRKMLWT